MKKKKIKIDSVVSLSNGCKEPTDFKSGLLKHDSSVYCDRELNVNVYSVMSLVCD